jgi:ribosomal protein S2
MLAATTHIGSENSEITMEPYVFKKRVSSLERSFM